MNGQHKILQLKEMLRRFEWQDDLDETACSTGFVNCMVCGGGGGWVGIQGKKYDKRYKYAIPKHTDDCELKKLLEE